MLINVQNAIISGSPSTAKAEAASNSIDAKNVNAIIMYPMTSDSKSYFCFTKLDEMS